MTEHSVDILTDGRWVVVRGVQKWQGETIAPPPRMPRARAGKRGTCGCGAPAHSSTALYCLDCWIIARRAAWRRSADRRRGRQVAA